MADQTTVTEGTLYIIGAVAVGTSAIVLWITAQFSKNRTLIYKELAKHRLMFFKALSLHNKEDDDRFEYLNNSMWDVHLRNAIKDGAAPPMRRSFQRRHYLDEAIAEGAGDVNIEDGSEMKMHSG